jgi:hypothetical protein
MVGSLEHGFFIASYEAESYSEDQDNDILDGEILNSKTRHLIFVLYLQVRIFRVLSRLKKFLLSSMNLNE